MIRKQPFLIFCLAAFLVGCTTTGSPTAIPTQILIPTEVSDTATAEEIIVETNTLAPSPIPSTSTPTTLSTPTGTNTPIPPTEKPANTAKPPSELNTPTSSEALETATPVNTTLPITTSVSTNPAILIVGVERNKAITVQTKDFPPNQIFTVRMGPFEDFSAKNVAAGTVKSGKGGTFKFTINIPVELTDVPRITIRLDSEQGFYAYDSFNNVNYGTVIYEITATPIISAVKCEVESLTKPTGSFSPKQNFDAIWIVKNTSGLKWDKNEVDYKYLSGKKMHKYEKIYDLPQTIYHNDTITIIVDMTAPDDEPGTYSTTWAIVQGTTTICELPITITVK